MLGFSMCYSSFWRLARVLPPDSCNGDIVDVDLSPLATCGSELGTQKSHGLLLKTGHFQVICEGADFHESR